MVRLMKSRAFEEGRVILLVLLAGWVGAVFVLPAVSLLFAVAIGFTLWFFRDPERVPPPGDHLAVSPADGVVTTVDEVEDALRPGGRLKRVAIFLSVFDVHVNRAPLAGEVTHSEPKRGKYLDARDPASSLLNVSRTWVFEGSFGRVVVRQITGAIARRICPWKAVGDAVERGERFGMIRFGSRTELLLPMDAEVKIAVGQKVRGGETVLASMPR